MKNILEELIPQREEKTNVNVDKWQIKKCVPNGQFYLTKNEKEFAQSHFSFYELFLVSNKILKVPNSDYNDENIFQLDSREYIVRYSIG